MMLTRDEVKRLRLWDAVGGPVAAAIASFLSRNYLYFLATGFSMVYMIEVFLLLHRSLQRPRIGDLPRVRRALVEIGVSFASHLLGGLGGALLTALVFGYSTPAVLLYLVTFSPCFLVAHSAQCRLLSCLEQSRLRRAYFVSPDASATTLRRHCSFVAQTYR